jgi:hypothetical protein
MNLAMDLLRDRENSRRKFGHASTASSNHGFEMKERAQGRVPSFVPWIGVVVAALTMIVFFVSSPTSHTRRSLCMAFASIYAEHCPGHSMRE